MTLSFFRTEKITAWPYTNFADDRLFMGKKFVSLRQIPGRD